MAAGLLRSLERGSTSQNFIELTPDLVSAFRAYWRVLVPPDTWLERIANPFRFMVQDGFWELIRNGVPVSTESLGYNPTIRQLTTEADGAQLAPDLWQLLQDLTAINALRTFLLKKYFSAGTTDVQPLIPANPIVYEVEKLIAEAQSKFRTRAASENKDETGYFIRKALFPKVIKALYNSSCSVCSLSIHAEEGGGIVDAVHIMPFGLFYNNDPRNGVALCKNHHWGFDAGWFSVTNDYKILVSPRLQNALTYITAGISLVLPAQANLAPAPDALAWHRANVYKR